MWTLVLVFLLSSQAPEYVMVRADDGVSCADQGQRMQSSIDGGCDALRWGCMGPGKESVKDECPAILDEGTDQPEGE